MRRAALLPVLLLCAAGAGFSLDFGLLMEHEIEATNDLVFYSPSLTPWFSWDGGKNISLYASGIIFLEYYKYDNDSDGSGWAKPLVRFDLARTALSWDINEKMSLEAGRVRYADALGFTAAGLFDGALFRMALPQGVINAGVLYTGLLYRESALILMTGKDAARYYEPWDTDLGCYFASSRLLTTARWDMPLFGDANILSAELLAQFDLNGSDDYLNSQYVEAKYEFYPTDSIGLSAGALLETMQNIEGVAAAFGLFAGMGTEVPGALNDWINVYIKFTSGSSNENFPAFMPISSVSQGEVFQEPLSGLMLLSGDYSLRLNKTMYAEAFLRYYIRTYKDSLAEGNLYGGELWGSFAWQPFDDVRLTAGGGVFLPGLGNAYPGADPMWKANAIFSMSF